MQRQVRQMSDTVLVAIIGLVGSGAGAFGGILVSSKLTQYRLEQLEKKVEMHNNAIDRIYKLESRMNGVEQSIEDNKEFLGEKIKVSNHRIDDLEKFHSPA